MQTKSEYAQTPQLPSYLTQTAGRQAPSLKKVNCKRDIEILTKLDYSSVTLTIKLVVHPTPVDNTSSSAHIHRNSNLALFSISTEVLLMNRKEHKT